MSSSSSLRSLASAEGIVALLQSRGPEIVAGLLVIAIGLQSAVLVTDLFGAGDPPPVDAAAAGYTPPAAGPAHRTVDLLAIANAHLFGQAETPAGDAANAPQTSMPLVLAGVIASSDPSKGYAIVGESAANARMHVVGDMLPGGARLHSVFGDRVILDRGGQLETLMLPRTSAPLAMGGAPQMPAGPPAAAPGGGPEAGSPAQRIRQIATEQPSAIGQVLRQQPVFADGRMRGFRVYPGQSRAAFANLGLRPGDLVTAINGTPLDDPNRSQEVFRTLGSASEARVTVVRNGRPQDLTLNLAQAAAQVEQAVGAQGATPVDQLPQVPGGASPGGAE